MVRGIESFKKWFKELEEQYVLIYWNNIMLHKVLF